MKFIISSSFLADILSNLDWIDMEREVELSVMGKKFSVSGIKKKALVETKEEIKKSYTMGQLFRLYKICRLIEDQPVTIALQDSPRWIGIGYIQC